MPRISKRQIEGLNRDFQVRNLQQEASAMVAQLRGTEPELMSRYSEAEQTKFAKDVIRAAHRAGVMDSDYILNWGYIRFSTGLEFYRMDEFKDILEHPFLHGDARGRHIVLAYFAIERMKGRTNA